jgi:beta-glucuronidase
MTNVYARQIQSLDGKWNAIIDPYDNGYYNYRYEPYDATVPPTGGYFLDRTPQDKTELLEYSFDRSPTLLVPRDWNSQDSKLLYYEGSIWYRRRFDCPPGGPGKRLFLYFGAANYAADVYLNGRKLGQHLGGFTPFEFEITGLVKDTGNSLVVRVNNQRRREGVPTLNTDWWNYGGLTRDVLLVETPETFVADYAVQLKPGTRDVLAAKIQLDGTRRPQTVRVAIPELKIAAQAVTDGAGRAVLEISAPNLALWSPANPQRYQVTVACDTDAVTEQIGFRSIAVRETDILLNGQPVFLRGISIHEENPLRGGRVGTEGEARMLLTWAKELNCNFVRLAHYPHNEYMARLADEMGLMVWEEIPVYWAILWDNPATLDNATNQLTDLINRDKNRASVIVWSVANETPVSEVRTRFLKALVDHARSLDDTRLISAAMEIHGRADDPDARIVDDPFGEFTDIVSFNEYIGWYDGLPDKCARIKWSIKYQKPVVISEFGADALQGLHADKLTRFSEEYQEDLYRQTLPMLQRIPQFRGVTPWILCDFRSPRRPLPNIEDGWNRKGLIGENGMKKPAFTVLKAFYDQLAPPKN